MAKGQSSMAALERFLGGIDKLTEWVAKGVIWLVVVLILTVVYEVVSRYGFNRPTFWHFEVSRMIAGTIFFLTPAWIMVRRSQVRVDLLYDRLSPRGKAILDVVFTLILVFPLWAIVLPYMVEWAADSWKYREFSADSSWRVPLYPIKTVLPIGIFLLMLVVLAVFIRDIKTIIRGEQ